MRMQLSQTPQPQVPQPPTIASTAFEPASHQTPLQKNNTTKMDMPKTQCLGMSPKTVRQSYTVTVTAEEQDGASRPHEHRRRNAEAESDVPFGHHDDHSNQTRDAHQPAVHRPQILGQTLHHQPTQGGGAGRDRPSIAMAAPSAQPPSSCDGGGGAWAINASRRSRTPKFLSALPKNTPV